jgi:hypothetical protein
MIRFFILLIIPFSGFSTILFAQSSFTERVDRAFGNDQFLINGIQFSNQYILVEGNPYWLDDRFRTGSLCINGLWYDHLQLRYNIYSGRLEMQYVTSEGNLNQIMTVAEHVTGFALEGQDFRRLELGTEKAAFYQIVTSGAWVCYVRRSMDLLGGGSYELRFSLPERTYNMVRRDQETDPDSWIRFHDRRTYLRALPRSRRKEFKKLLKERQFFFMQSTNREVVGMVEATLRMLEAGGEHEP